MGGDKEFDKFCEYIDLFLGYTVACFISLGFATSGLIVGLANFCFVYSYLKSFHDQQLGTSVRELAKTSGPAVSVAIWRSSTPTLPTEPLSPPERKKIKVKRKKKPGHGSKDSGKSSQTAQSLVNSSSLPSDENNEVSHVNSPRPELPIVIEEQEPSQAEERSNTPAEDDRNRLDLPRQPKKRSKLDLL